MRTLRQDLLERWAMNHPAPRIQRPLRLALSEVQGCDFCGQRPAVPQQPDPDPPAVLSALERTGRWENPISISDKAKCAYVVGGLGDSWICYVCTAAALRTLSEHGPSLPADTSVRCSFCGQGRSGTETYSQGPAPVCRVCLQHISLGFSKPSVPAG